MVLMNDDIQAAGQSAVVEQLCQAILIMGLDPIAHEAGRHAGLQRVVAMTDQAHGLDPTLIGSFADLGAQGFTNFGPGVLQFLARLYFAAVLFRHFATNVRPPLKAGGRFNFQGNRRSNDL